MKQCARKYQNILHRGAEDTWTLGVDGDYSNRQTIDYLCSIAHNLGL